LQQIPLSICNLFLITPLPPAHLQNQQCYPSTNIPNQ
jgi:hypothetical protein